MENVLCPRRDIDHICPWPTDQNLSHELLTRKGSELGGQQIPDIWGAVATHSHFICEVKSQDFATSVLTKELLIVERRWGERTEDRKEINVEV